MKRLLLFIIIVILLVFQMATEEANEPFEILNRIDSNMTFKNAYVEMDMVINIKKRKIKKVMRSWSEGNSRSFIEFLSPARDKGTKILKTGKIIKIYYPSAERVMRLSGHMLRQSMMGSDMSYEDMTERSKELKEDYTGKMQMDEILDG
ncbi:MAG: outer membrane lipoprotein-sorting protein, partial [Candidatus Aminicenantes bacterium]|nr:outer membrane lipoprotein-sorting protein [Candidatus Aminicenantes bacterium]